MPNLQDLRRRVRSVRNMQKITRSYKMVSAAKLRRAQDRVIAARPYANTMMRVLGRLAAGAGDYKHPLLEVRGDEHYLVALVTADRGLCGAFNSNLIKAAQHFMRENPDKQIDLVTVGRKGRDFFRRRGASIVNEYVNITAKTVNHADAITIARELMDLYTAEDSKIDRVYIIYSEFKSVMSQRLTVKQLLPVSQESISGESTADDSTIDYIYEQPPAEILGRLLPRYIETQVYYAMLESVASEHGARMTAMEAASKNAGELIESLTLTMNRARQASITREIIEVVSGSQSLKS